MNVRLAVETAGEAVGVALAVDDEIVSSAWVTTRAASSELVMSMVADALDQTGIAATRITELVGCRGPGSFTGIRVGLATLRGLAYARGIGIRTLTAFEVEVEVAAGVPTSGPILVAIDARRGQLYVQGFAAGMGSEQGGTVGAPAIVEPTVDGLRAASPDPDVSLVGSGVVRYRDVFAAAFPRATVMSGARPRVEALVTAALRGWGTDAVSPFYLRLPDARLPSGPPR